MYDWLLFLHVLAAFALVAAVVMISSVVLGAAAPPRVVSVANLLWDVGGLGTLVLGVWRALPGRARRAGDRCYCHARRGSRVTTDPESRGDPALGPELRRQSEGEGCGSRVKAAETSRAPRFRLEFP
jgi:hypothetical protein